MLEMGAYECLWADPRATQKRVCDRLRANPGSLPSSLVPQGKAREMARWVIDYHRERGVTRFGVRIHRAGEYPWRLRDARHPVEVLQYRGIWELSEGRCVAIVGTRTPSEDGLRRTRKLATLLARHGFTVVSGLAAGVDTQAHRAAMAAGAPTIAVIGTPVSDSYPRANAALQGEIAAHHLLISEVPVYRHAQGDWRANRRWFPRRNATMSALSEATIIVEAGNTSGTLIQARAALYQKRKLFILNSCFERPDLTWPARFEREGAIRVRDLDDILDRLERRPVLTSHSARLWSPR